MKNTDQKANADKPVSRDSGSGAAQGSAQQQQITVKVARAKREEVGEPVRVKIDYSFFPDSIGPEREKAVYEGLGKMISGLLEPDEAHEFLEKFEKQRAARARKR